MSLLSLEDAFQPPQTPQGGGTSSPPTPADVALALTNFLRYELSPQVMILPDESEQFVRLCRAFPKILEFVFGTERTITLNSGSTQSSSTGTGPLVSIVLDGGLMNRSLTPNWGQTSAVLFQSSVSNGNAARRAPISGLVHPSKQNVMSSINQDVLVKLLSPAYRMKGKDSKQPQQSENVTDNLVTLFDAAIMVEDQEEGGPKFIFPIKGLPEPTRSLLLKVATSSRSRVASSSWPLNSQYRREQWNVGTTLETPSADECKPSRENTMKLFQSTLKVPLSEQTGLFSEVRNNNMYAASNVIEQSSPLRQHINESPPLENTEEHMYLQLSMFEVLVFTFMRFGIVRVITSSVVLPHQQGLQTYGDRVFCRLFRTFVTYFFPSNSSLENNLPKRAELFLRVLVDFWMDGMNVYVPASEVGYRTNNNLANAYDHCQVSGSYHSPPTLVIKILRELVCYFCFDKDLERRILVAKSEATGVWCLSPALTLLQQPLFNFINAALRFAPIHSGNCFHTALSMWLLLLEPWNRTKHPHGSGQHARELARQKLNNLGIHGKSNNGDDDAFLVPDARCNEASRYTKNWESYIIANAHFYTTTLAIFLRRARELDFSRNSFNRSLQIVQRVFRVFTQDIIEVISSVSKKPSNYPLLSFHEQNLGAFCPQGSMNLSGCTDDMKMLFEELVIQHRKNLKSLNFLEKIEDTLEGFFNSSAGSKGVKSNINRLTKIARKMVDLPLDIPMLPSTSTRANGTTTFKDDLSKRFPERDPTTGLLLTRKGSMQVLSGTRQCGPLDIPTIGDPLTSSVIGSYEIPFLVRLTIRLSNWLNKKFGFVIENGKDDMDSIFETDSSLLADRLVMRNVLETEQINKLWFRFNLRFFADWRLLVLHIMILCLARAFMSIIT